MSAEGLYDIGNKKWLKQKVIFSLAITLFKNEAEVGLRTKNYKGFDYAIF